MLALEVLAVSPRLDASVVSRCKKRSGAFERGLVLVTAGLTSSQLTDLSHFRGKPSPLGGHLAYFCQVDLSRVDISCSGSGKKDIFGW